MDIYLRLNHGAHLGGLSGFGGETEGSEMCSSDSSDAAVVFYTGVLWLCVENVCTQLADAIVGRPLPVFRLCIIRGPACESIRSSEDGCRCLLFSS